MSNCRKVALSPEDIHRYQIVFEAFDKDKNGSLSIGELAAMFEAIHYHYTPQSLRRAMEAMDLDHSNSIDWEEWLAYLESHKPIVPENFTEIALSLANDPDEAKEHEKRKAEAEVRYLEWQMKTAADISARRSTSSTGSSSMRSPPTQHQDLDQMLVTETEHDMKVSDSKAAEKKLTPKHSIRTMKVMKDAHERASALRFEFTWTTNSN